MSEASSLSGNRKSESRTAIRVLRNGRSNKLRGQEAHPAISARRLHRRSIRRRQFRGRQIGHSICIRSLVRGIDKEDRHLIANAGKAKHRGRAIVPAPSTGLGLSRLGALPSPRSHGAIVWLLSRPHARSRRCGRHGWWPGRRGIRRRRRCLRPRTILNIVFGMIVRAFVHQHQLDHRHQQ